MAKYRVDFTSLDYLGLSEHHELKKRAIRAILQEGIKTSFSLKDSLEKKLSLILDVESVLFFSSRYALYTHLLAKLSPDLILIDSAADCSFVRDAELLKIPVQIFPHHDFDALEKLLENSALKIVITESLSTIEGDRTDLERFSHLVKKHQALLLVDDTHAFGVKGKNGMGLCRGLGLFMSSFGFGGGAFLASSKLLRDHLVQNMDEMEPSPSHFGAIDAAIDLILQSEGERKTLEQRSYWLSVQLKEMGFTIKKTPTHLIPLMMPSEEEALGLQSALNDADIGVDVLHYPLENNFRLMIALSCSHGPDALHYLLRTLKTLPGIALQQLLL